MLGLTVNVKLRYASEAFSLLANNVIALKHKKRKCSLLLTVYTHIQWATIHKRQPKMKVSITLFPLGWNLVTLREWCDPVIYSWAVGLWAERETRYDHNETKCKGYQKNYLGRLRCARDTPFIGFFYVTDGAYKQCLIWCFYLETF